MVNKAHDRLDLPRVNRFASTRPHCGYARPHSTLMSRLRLRFLVLLGAVSIALFPAGVSAQSTNDAKQVEQQRAAESKQRADEIAEAARAVSGPAGNPECVWLGQRAVILMSQDDLDTSFRHLDLYDRFGCPGAHVQASFRCLLRGGLPDAKAVDTLRARVHACWLNPTAPPAAAAAAPPPGTAATGAPQK